MSASQEKYILRIGSYHIHRLEYNLQAKTSKTDEQQSIIGKACKSHQGRLHKNKSFSVFVAFKYVDSSTTYTLNYEKQISGNQ